MGYLFKCRHCASCRFFKRRVKSFEDAHFTLCNVQYVCCCKWAFYYAQPVNQKQIACREYVAIIDDPRPVEIPKKLISKPVSKLRKLLLIK